MHHPLLASPIEIININKVLYENDSIDINYKSTVHACIDKFLDNYETSNHSIYICDMSTALLYFYNRKKDEFIYFIRECTLKDIFIKKAEIPFFEIVVSNYANLIFEARKIGKL